MSLNMGLLASVIPASRAPACHLFLFSAFLPPSQWREKHKGELRASNTKASWARSTEFYHSRQYHISPYNMCHLYVLRFNRILATSYCMNLLASINTQLVFLEYNTLLIMCLQKGMNLFKYIIRFLVVINGNEVGILQLAHIKLWWKYIRIYQDSLEIYQESVFIVWVWILTQFLIIKLF